MNPESPEGRATWETLDKWILGGRNSDYRKVANNTLAIRRGDDIAIRLHNTDILLWSRDRVIYDVGEWFTVTTKDRLNRFGPSGFHIHQQNRIWYLAIPSFGSIRYYNGLTVDLTTDTVANLSEAPNFDSVDKSNRETTNAIHKYVTGLTDSVLADLVESNSTLGDCLYCQMALPGNNDHLETHLKESYYMGSLIRNAYIARGYSDPSYVLGLDLKLNGNRVRQTVGRYLRDQLLVDVA